MSRLLNDVSVVNQALDRRLLKCWATCSAWWNYHCHALINLRLGLVSNLIADDFHHRFFCSLARRFRVTRKNIGELSTKLEEDIVASRAQAFNRVQLSLKSSTP